MKLACAYSSMNTTSLRYLPDECHYRHTFGGQYTAQSLILNLYRNLGGRPIPIIGKFFRDVNERKAKSEVVIIITPRILQKESVSDNVRNPVLQNDLNALREGEPWTPFTFPAKKK